MELPSATELKALVAALAPGLVILGIRQRFIAGPPPSLQDRAIAYAAVSAVYYAIFSPIMSFAKTDLGLLTWVSNAFEYVGIPMGVGLLFGAATATDWGEKFWRLTGIQPVHQIPTAWDFTFSRLQQGRFVLVTLADGSTVAGLYGWGSFASSTSGERDLLIADVWEVAEGEWTRAATPKSILLCGRDIRHVELFKGTEA